MTKKFRIRMKNTENVPIELIYKTGYIKDCIYAPEDGEDGKSIYLLKIGRYIVKATQDDFEILK